MEHVPVGAVWDADRALMLTLNGSWGSWWDSFWWLATQPWFWLPVFVVALWAIYRRWGVWGMLAALGLIVLGVAMADQTANFFKYHTPKFRPSRTLLLWDGVPYNSMIHNVKNVFTGNTYIGGQFGTVSGHAATSMAIALTTAGIYRGRWMACMMGVYVVMTCWSRIYLGVHFPLDILFGLTAGTLIGLAMLLIWNRLILPRLRPRKCA